MPLVGAAGTKISNATTAVKNSAPVRAIGSAYKKVKTTARDMRERVDSKRKEYREAKERVRDDAYTGPNAAADKAADIAKIKNYQDKTSSKVIRGFKTMGSGTWRMLKSPGMVKAGAGFAAGSMAFGAPGTGPIAAMVAGTAMAGMAGEFMKSSTKTVKKSLEELLVFQQSMGRNFDDPEDAVAFFQSVKSAGATGEYEATNMQEKLKDTVEEIKRAIGAAFGGVQPSTLDAKGILAEIKREQITNPEQFDAQKMRDIVNNMVTGLNGGVPKSSADIDKIIKDGKIDEYSDFINRSKINEGIQQAEAVGLEPTKKERNEYNKRER